MKVWRPLMQLVHSDLTEAAAAQRLRPFIEADRFAARLSRRALVKESQRSGGYVGDRATRIIARAMGVPAPAPPSASDQLLFEREHQLGSKPLQEAFAELALHAPSLRLLEEEAKRLGAMDTRGRGAELAIAKQCYTILGPDAGTNDPLLRSRVALMLGLNYLSVLEGRMAPEMLRSTLFDHPGDRIHLEF